MCIMHIECAYVILVASFPGLPRFRSSVCVQYNTWKQKRSSASVYYTECKPKNKKKRGRPGNEASILACCACMLVCCACMIHCACMLACMLAWLSTECYRHVRNVVQVNSDTDHPHILVSFIPERRKEEETTRKLISF